MSLTQWESEMTKAEEAKVVELVQAFMVEVKMEGKWTLASGKVYGDLESADAKAKKLVNDWFEMEDARVVEIEAPEGYEWAGKGAVIKRIGSKESVAHTKRGGGTS